MVYIENNWFVLAVVIITIILILLYRMKVINGGKGSVGVLLTLVGLFLTIGTDFSSQFDYNLCQMFVKILDPNNNLKFNKDISVNQKETPPFYIFALDVSGSMKYQKEENFTNLIKNKINDINEYMVHHGGKSICFKQKKISFDKDAGGSQSFDELEKISFPDLLKVRLINSLVKLTKDKRKNGQEFSYCVVLFDSIPSRIVDTLDEKAEMDSVCDTIINQPSNGKETDFIKLFDHFNSVIDDMCMKERDKYKPVDCYIAIYSDCLHDVKRNFSKQDVESNLKQSLNKIHRKNVNLRFFIPNRDRDEKVKKDSCLPIEDIIKDVFPKSPIGLLDEDDELVCTIISEKPISFFYKNSLFEEELTTHLKFDNLKHKRDYYFGLGKNSNIDELKQEYYLIDGTDTFHLSSHPQSIRLDLNDEIEFKIKGYIPAPYISPDVLIRDEEGKTQYIVPVAFYKELPLTGYLLLAMIIPISILLLWSLIRTLYHKIKRSPQSANIQQKPNIYLAQNPNNTQQGPNNNSQQSFNILNMWTEINVTNIIFWNRHIYKKTNPKRDYNHIDRKRISDK